MVDLIGELDMSDDMFDSEADRQAAADYHYEQVQHDSDEDDSEDEYIPAGLSDGTYKFPPKSNKDWKRISSRTLPHVTYDAARTLLWKHGKKEIDFFLGKVEELRGIAQNSKDEDLYNIVKLLCGRDSDLYQAFRKVMKMKTSHKEFVVWVSTFLFSSRRGENYNKLCKDKRIDTSDFMDAKEYATIWKQIRDYGKGSRYHKLAWELFQESFNQQ